ncbi:MAG TPA: Rieske (2Fe-2S) protein [Ktedonobacterales bacterium]|nr:Rieske (2Fe-2S) protein [Ktedonobacterales bacterium]
MDLDSETPGAESVEQYVQLHEHIERLRADRRPLPPFLHSDDEALPYQMAALLHSAAPDAATPDPEFVQSLRARLRAQMADAADPRVSTSEPTLAQTPTSVAPVTPIGPVRRGISRRGLLRTGLASAAAASVGVAVGASLERAGHSGSPAKANVAVPLVENGNGIWVSVAQADAIPVGGVMRFNTDYIVGFVRHTGAGFSALSGVCTHMGCILQWNGGARTFDCPCHGGRFTENGDTATNSPVAYRPLPPLQTKIERGQVWVYVVPPTAPSQPSATSGYNDHSTPSGD